MRTLADIDGIGVGSTTDEQGLTGCTVVVFRGGAVCGVAERGVASGSRELAVISPRHSVGRAHAICLCGGSAYGLAAADGVMRELEAAGIGHETPAGRVPLVPAAVVYDLALGDPAARPDARAGAEATRRALAGEPARSGNVGAGCGVSAGKLLGTRHATKTGLGHAGILSDEGLAIAAAVVLNPVGDVIGSDGAIIAGARSTPDGRAFCNIADVVRAGAKVETQVFNTVLAVVGTNAALTRDEARWVADQAAVAIGRRVDPPFTRHDGDVVFCASVGDFSCDIHRVGLLARDVLSAAIDDAVWSAEPAGGLPSASVIRAGG